MISDSEKEIILQCAKKFEASTVILFGSSLGDEQNANDIDLGVKGIDPRQFFKFHAELFKKPSKPVDLVDLTRKSLFNDLIEETGMRIYG